MPSINWKLYGKRQYRYKKYRTGDNYRGSKSNGNSGYAYYPSQNGMKPDFDYNVSTPWGSTGKRKYYSRSKYYR